MGTPGAELKKIRLEKGISLEEVQKRTKIQLNILKAIEGDSLTDLSPVYLKGFLKIYCNLLGVDPKDFITEFKEPKAQASLAVAKPAPAVAKPAPAVAKPPTAVTRSSPVGAPRPVSPKSQPKIYKRSLSLLEAALKKGKSLKVYLPVIKKAALFIIVSLVVIFTFYNLGKFVSSKRKAFLAKRKIHAAQAAKPSVRKAVEKTTPKTTPKITASPAAAAVPAVVPSAAPAVVAETKVPHKESVSGIRLGVRARENCWVFVKVDGKVVFQRTLEKGRFESWQAKDKIELSVGNAASVELEVNGQLFSNLGRKGQALKNIVITKDGLNILR